MNAAGLNDVYKHRSDPAEPSAAILGAPSDPPRQRRNRLSWRHDPMFGQTEETNDRSSNRRCTSAGAYEDCGD